MRMLWWYASLNNVKCSMEELVTDQVLANISNAPKQSHYLPGNRADEIATAFCQEIKPFKDRINSLLKTVANIEEYMGKTYRTKRDPVKNKYGYWENPNKKWDSWRPIPWLKLKNGRKAVTAKIKDIDFSPDPEIYAREIRFWEINTDGQKPESQEDEILHMLMLQETPEYYLKKYTDKKEYATSQARLSTWAVVTPDGKWHEPSSTTHDSVNEFKTKVNNILEETNPEYHLTIVDCHI